VTGGDVKGQDERPFRAPLTAPPVTTGSIQHGRKLALGGLNTRKTDTTGNAVGRPSCESSLLSGKLYHVLWIRSIIVRTRIE
jgi:hypothetical protein